MKLNKDRVLQSLEEKNTYVAMSNIKEAVGSLFWLYQRPFLPLLKALTTTLSKYGYNPLECLGLNTDYEIVLTNPMNENSSITLSFDENFKEGICLLVKNSGISYRTDDFEKIDQIIQNF